MLSNSQSNLLYLGIDGGGTKTAAWLGRSSHGELHVVGRGVGGAGNLRAIGFTAAMQNIDQAIAAAFNAAGLPRQTVHGVCMCLAGAGRPAEQAQVRLWAGERQIADESIIVGDAEVMLAATPSATRLGPYSGVALIAGTGSMAWGRGVDGRTARCGGWGYLLGDEGSGYALGSAGLRLACRTADGRESEFQLLQALLAATGCTDPRQLIDWTYASAAPRERIARLAGVVLDQVPGSAAVRLIVDSAARELSQMVRSVVRALDLECYTLAIAGGVLCHRPAYVQQVQQFLLEDRCAPSSTCLVEHPVLGALRIAHSRTAAR